MRPQAWVAIVLACVAAPARPTGAPHLPPVRYRVVDLGTLPGCDVTHAAAVNAAGAAVGHAYRFVAPGHGGSMLSRPIVWRSGRPIALRSAGGAYGQALAINARGQIGGYSETAAGLDLPVIWPSASARPRIIDRRPGVIRALLHDGSAAGELAGRALIWRGGRVSLPGDPADAEACANALNASGLAAGFYTPAGRPTQSIRSQGERHAALWRAGLRIALPELGGECSEATAMNEAGAVVGWSDSPAGRRACLWRDGRVAQLPTPPEFTSEARSINRAGLIVGEALPSGPRGAGRWHAVLWRDGRAIDLNTLIAPGSRWQLCVAAHIADSGRIVGYGDFARFPSHRWRAFLLEPVSASRP